jgi:RNA polymerase sigma-70 factor (ECF subfamily)
MTYKSAVSVSFLNYRNALAKVISRIVKSDDVEDIVQETFLKSYEAGLKTEITHQRTYMLTIAKNLALNHVSKASVRKNQSLDDLQTLPIDLASTSLESQIASKERFLHFCQATETLSVDVKRVFILKKVHGMSQKEIADNLGISQSTVEKHVAKGLLQCSTYLSDLVSESSNVTRLGNKVSEQFRK